MDIILKRILDLKSERKISDAQFVKDLGLYSSIVSEWKNGSSKSYMKHLPKIANYLHTTAAYLNGEADDPCAKTPAQHAPTDGKHRRDDSDRIYRSRWLWGRT